MKKKSRVSILFIIILLLASGAVFFLGYTSLQIKQDCIGVLVSKTSGVSQNPIVPGKFCWNWERLIPTNSTLKCFSTKSYSYNKIKTGELPSGEVYSKMFVENVPSFKYSLNIQFELKATPQEIVRLVKQSDISTDAELTKKYEIFAEEIAEKIISTIVRFYTLNSGEQYFDLEELKKTIISDYVANNTEIEITSLNILDAKLPDKTLYVAAKDMYSRYMSQIEVELQSLTSSQAREIAEATKNLNKLEQFGKVLRNYNELGDLLKNSHNMNETLNAIISGF